MSFSAQARTPLRQNFVVRGPSPNFMLGGLSPLFVFCGILHDKGLPTGLSFVWKCNLLPVVKKCRPRCSLWGSGIAAFDAWQ